MTPQEQAEASVGKVYELIQRLDGVIRNLASIKHIWGCLEYMGELPSDASCDGISSEFDAFDYYIERLEDRSQQLSVAMNEFREMQEADRR